MSESDIPAAPAAVGARAYYMRARNLLLTPTAEWGVIAGERATTEQLFLRWVLPFTVFFFVAGQLGDVAFQDRPVVPALGTIIVGTAFMCAGVYALAWVIDYLSKHFEGERNAAQAMKLAAYSGTGLWLSGVFGLVPALMLLSALGLVAIYTLYRGLPVLMKTPPDKALPYAASVVAVGAVLGVILMALSGCFAMIGGAAVRPPPRVIEAPRVLPPPVQRATDPRAPIESDKMRRLLPEAIPGGWVRAGVSSNNGGTLGLTGPTVEAVYERGERRMILRVIDLGPGRAPDMITALRVTRPAFVDDKGAVSHGEAQGRYVFEETDRVRGVVRWLTVAGDRVAVAAEGERGVTQAELAEALALVDMVRVEQIAKGL
jgi:hypothetical protein